MRVASIISRGNALERGIEAEGEIPDLAGEDEQDDAHLDAHLVAGHQSDHGQAPQEGES